MIFSAITPISPKWIIWTRWLL